MHASVQLEPTGPCGGIGPNAPADVKVDIPPIFLSAIIGVGNGYDGDDRGL